MVAWSSYAKHLVRGEWDFRSFYLGEGGKGREGLHAKRGEWWKVEKRNPFSQLAERGGEGLTGVEGNAGIGEERLDVL